MNKNMLIEVNLPESKYKFQSGNGEGVWVEVTEEVKSLHDEDFHGGEFTGIMRNSSLYYPELEWGAEVKFTMRGTRRPIALIKNYCE